jgi:alpha-soluble NSF attachment protein
MPSAYASKARGLASQADRKLLGWNLFGNKYEDASELYEQAANQFKLGKLWKEAGETYTKLAEVAIKLESKHDAASAYVEAAKAYQKIGGAQAAGPSGGPSVDDSERGGKPSEKDVSKMRKKAISSLEQAVSLYTEMGRLGMAARQLREIAEQLEKEAEAQSASGDSDGPDAQVDRSSVIMFYEQAADLFYTDHSTAESNKCMLKVAQYSALGGDYGKAVRIYEQVARASVDNNLLKFSAKGHLLLACLCLLCSSRPDVVLDKIEEYKDVDFNFDKSREAILAESCARAMEDGDVDLFTGAVADFDSLTRLDGFKTEMLLRAKRKMSSAGELSGDEDDLT